MLALVPFSLSPGVRIVKLFQLIPNGLVNFKINCFGHGVDRLRQPEAFCMADKNGFYIFKRLFKKKGKGIYDRDLMWPKEPQIFIPTLYRKNVIDPPRFKLRVYFSGESRKYTDFYQQREESEINCSNSLQRTEKKCFTKD